MFRQAHYTFKSAAINPQLIGSIGGGLAGGLGGYLAADSEDTFAGKALYTLGGAALGGSAGYAISHVPGPRNQGGAAPHAPAAAPHAPAAAPHAPAAAPPAPAARRAATMAGPSHSLMDAAAAPAAIPAARVSVPTMGGSAPAGIPPARVSVPTMGGSPPITPPSQNIPPNRPAAEQPKFNNYAEFLKHEHPHGISKALMNRMQGLEQSGVLGGGSLHDYKNAQNLMDDLRGLSREELMRERGGLDARGQQIVDYLLGQAGQNKSGALSPHLIGTLAGAATGGLAGYYGSDPDDRFAATLGGAGLGGALGLGFGHLVDTRPLKKKVRDATENLEKSRVNLRNIEARTDEMLRERPQQLAALDKARAEAAAAAEAAKARNWRDAELDLRSFDNPGLEKFLHNSQIVKEHHKGLEAKGQAYRSLRDYLDRNPNVDPAIAASMEKIVHEAQLPTRGYAHMAGLLGEYRGKPREALLSAMGKLNYDDPYLREHAGVLSHLYGNTTRRNSPHLTLTP